jgi:DNA-binding LacI/PurR family transcriptional regulator
MATTPTGLMARTAVLITHGQGALSDNPDLYAAGRAELAVDAGVTQALHAHGMHVLYISSASFEEAEANQLIAGKPCGVIAGRPASTFPRVPQLLRMLKNNGVNLIATGHDAEIVGSDRVISDHDAGAYMLTRWLIDRGHKRIVEMGTGGDGNQLGWVRNRTVGYTRAMKEAGLEVLPRVLATNVEPAHKSVIGPAPQRGKVSNESREVFRRRVQQIAGFVASVVLGTNPVDAIMASNDWDASLILAACRLLGLEPNKQVAVVGYDDWWNTEEREWEPAVPLATVDKRNADIGREAVRMLLERVNGKLPPEPQIWKIEPRLVELVPAEVS